MALTTSKTRESVPLLPLPPLSRAHQEGLHLLIRQLQEQGQDITLLTQLAESLPRLRAGLSAAERERIEALDASEATFTAALTNVQVLIDAVDALLAPEPVSVQGHVLLDSTLLCQIAATAQTLAEAATDLALRATARAGLLES